MPPSNKRPTIPLPRAWSQSVKSAVLHVISLAQFTLAYTRGWAASSTSSRIRLKAELERANQEIALLREEVRIKDARMGRIDPHRRPYYPPTERLTGSWCPWFPFALPQCWPFAWHLGFVVDHFSRRVMGYAVFRKQPTSDQVRTMLGRAISAAGKAPRHIVCDRGPQFDCAGFRRWCRRKGIQPPRYGAVRKHGSLAVIERLILSVKLLFRFLPTVPMRASAFRHEVGLVVDWYNCAPYCHTFLCA